MYEMLHEAPSRLAGCFFSVFSVFLLVALLLVPALLFDLLLEVFWSFPLLGWAGGGGGGGGGLAGVNVA